MCYNSYQVGKGLKNVSVYTNIYTKTLTKIIVLNKTILQISKIFKEKCFSFK